MARVCQRPKLSIEKEREGGEPEVGQYGKMKRASSRACELWDSKRFTAMIYGTDGSTLASACLSLTQPEETRRRRNPSGSL